MDDLTGCLVVQNLDLCAYAMIPRRATAADIETKIGNHTFRATGITAYLKNGGTLEKPPQWPITLRRGRRSSTIVEAIA
jgi:hypothetical protein